MKKSKRLGALLSLAELKEKEAIKAMVQVRKQKIVEEQKLEQLEGFHEQYIESTQKKEESGVNVSRMLENRRFADLISGAIREQETRVSAIEKQIQAHHDKWSQYRHDRRGFEKLIHSEIRNQARFQEKREQTEIDDRSGRKQAPSDRNGTKSAK